jgi:phosphoserine phosphatase
MNLKERVIVLDLDFTLINVNTTFDFLNFLRPRRFYIFSKILKPVAFLNRFLERDIYKFLLVLLCIKGMPEKLLRKRSIEYYSQIGKKYINYQLLKYVTSLPLKKILVTASLDIIAENFKNFGFDIIIASRTYYKKGKLHRFVDLFGRKHAIVQHLKRHYKEIIIIEDSPEQKYYEIDNVRVLSPRNICQNIQPSNE